MAIDDRPEREVSPGRNRRQAFENHEVAIGGLPDFRRVELSPVASAYLPYSVLTTTLFWLVLAGVAVAARHVPFVPFDPGWWLPALALLAACWFAGIAWLDARRRGWAVRAHDLIYRSGVLWRRTVIVPFARIQHVETASGPIERMFGLMRVKCFTAGGTMADLSVEGLDTDNARRVRQYLLEQIRDDGHEQPDDEG